MRRKGDNDSPSPPADGLTRLTVRADAHDSGEVVTWNVESRTKAAGPTLPNMNLETNSNCACYPCIMQGYFPLRQTHTHAGDKKKDN
ncbi:uncharacterized protein TEOVI_000652300 [Trypanosoma equiperdum]|uniref:Uncharacterized protein n=2 Tax=Trypanozoon TaxID=39700 RepID=Q38EB5_TRYB2|nr:hypothetical protein, unlikely [Trypanosoma brucei brucei TREU927]EAN76855.1 hypothetical protein, unlikely [Trypanosoma brucei brucei TREU927]SCU64683.1 hypothetical protein, conserved [Trypanosoma equiperdum]